MIEENSALISRTKFIHKSLFLSLFITYLSSPKFAVGRITYRTVSDTDIADNYSNEDTKSTVKCSGVACVISKYKIILLLFCYRYLN